MQNLGAQTKSIMVFSELAYLNVSKKNGRQSLRTLMAFFLQ